MGTGCRGDSPDTAPGSSGWGGQREAGSKHHGCWLAFCKANSGAELPPAHGLIIPQEQGSPLTLGLAPPARGLEGQEHLGRRAFVSLCICSQPVPAGELLPASCSSETRAGRRAAGVPRGTGTEPQPPFPGETRFLVTQILQLSTGATTCQHCLLCCPRCGHPPLQQPPVTQEPLSISRVHGADPKSSPLAKPPAAQAGRMQRSTHGARMDLW